MQLVALVVFVALIALLWLVVMQWLEDDGVPVRAALEEDAVVRTSSAEQTRDQLTRTAPGGGLSRAKDRNVAQTWGSGL